MKRRIYGLGLTAVIATAALTACGPVDVTIVAALGDDLDPGANAINALEVHLLPFDRDALFDSLEAEAPRPEPEIPADLLEAQEQIAVARQEWREAETSWGILRDTLPKLTVELDELDPGMRLYQELFLQWEELDAQRQRAERDKTSRFETFTSLQAATIDRMDSINFLRDDWAEEAFADFPLVEAAKIGFAGLDAMADTTNAAGLASLRVAPGAYWVHARYELTTEELYWNVPITVVRGEPLEVRLTRENAEIRPIY